MAEKSSKKPSKKIPAKKIPEKEVPVKKVPVKKVPVKKVPVKKVPVKKVPVKKVPVSGSQKKEKIVPELPFSLVSDGEEEVFRPNLISPEVEQLIDGVETEIRDVLTGSESEVIAAIQRFALSAAVASKAALTNSATALIFAWGCGALLNAKKQELGYGKFGKWRTENCVNRGFSERSSTRYMRLAEAYSNIRALLAWSPGLTKSYIACGILPEISPTAGSGEKEIPHPTQVLRDGVNKFQQSLHLFAKTLDFFGKSNEKLSPEDKEEIYLMKEAISKFTQRISELLP